MCLNPIQIINPTKYINTNFKDSFLMRVPCGKCAECQSRKSQEWMYRTYYEFADCINKGGFVYFDTLTYSNEFVPRVCNFGWSDSDAMCFNHKDITDFLKRLRIALNRKYKATCRYFLSSEYGTSENYSHRPHYHVLFFVHGCTWVQFSQLVASCWLFGRTDGIPYKSRYYVVDHNVIATYSDSNFLRASAYVTKYIQKSCKFQAKLDKLINKTMYEIANKMDNADIWLSSVNARKVRSKITRSINQFHRQSLHFGESALSEIDISKLFDTGSLYMKHYKGIYQPIGLPTYFKRKLFYELVVVDGCRCWQLTELGIEYKKKRNIALVNDLANKYKSQCLQFGYDYDCKKLADYVLNYRGRFKSNEPSWTIENRLRVGITFYNYCTQSDKQHLDHLGVSTCFLGNNTIGYKVDTLKRYIKFSSFIAKYVYLDPYLEKQLDELQTHSIIIDQGKQDSFALKQDLLNLYKQIK